MISNGGSDPLIPRIVFKISVLQLNVMGILHFDFGLIVVFKWSETLLILYINVDRNTTIISSRDS